MAKRTADGRIGQSRRERFRRIVSRGNPPCALCGEPIDYQAPAGDPRAFELDHVVPRSRGGSDLLDNYQPSHRDCNRRKSATMPGDVEADDLGEVEYVTSRCWW